MMLGFGDVIEKYVAHLFRVDSFDVDDDEGHEHFLRFDNDSGRTLFGGDPERFEGEERIENLVHDDAPVVDLVMNGVRLAGSVDDEGKGGNDDEDAEDDVVEDERQRGAGQGNDADCPVPVVVFLGIYMFRSIP